MKIDPNREEIELELSARVHLLARRRPRPEAPRIVFCHGAGLSVAAYKTFQDILAQGYEVISFDLRGHGANCGLALPKEGIIDRLTADFEAVWQALDAALDPRPTMGVFHSISGILALRQMLQFGPRWKALALLDPPLTPPAGHRLSSLKQKGTETMVRRTANRRHRFLDPKAYALDLSQRPEFSGWEEGAHALLAEATLRCDMNTGDWLLCVLPALEAQIYRENVDPELPQQLASLSTPLRFICSDPNTPHASPIPTLCKAIAVEFGIEFEIVRGTTHMLPLEQPVACANAATAFLAANGFPPTS